LAVWVVDPRMLAAVHSWSGSRLQVPQEQVDAHLSRCRHGRGPDHRRGRKASARASHHLSCRELAQLRAGSAAIARAAAGRVADAPCWQFTNAAVRELQPVMEKHGASLAAKIGSIIDGAVARRSGKAPAGVLQDGESPPDAQVALHSWPGSSAVVDVLFWASRTALDVIGDAGFNYQFNSLDNGNADELSEAYNNLMTACMDVDLVQAFTILLSEIRGLGWMRGIPTRRQKMIASARATSQRYATQIVSRAKQEIAGEVAATIVPSMRSPSATPCSAGRASTTRPSSSSQCLIFGSLAVRSSRLSARSAPASRRSAWRCSIAWPSNQALSRSVRLLPLTS